jgi:hypothetical protein
MKALNIFTHAYIEERLGNLLLYRYFDLGRSYIKTLIEYEKICATSAMIQVNSA